MQIVDLLVIGLATWQAVEIFHHSVLFAEDRARVEEGTGFWDRVLTCPWCLSVWVALALAAWCMTMPIWFHIPVWALAASRLANVFNDLGYPWTRTPGSGPNPEPEEFSPTILKFGDKDARNRSKSDA